MCSDQKHSNQARQTQNANVCTSCSLREFCVPASKAATEINNMGNLVSLRRRVKRGDALFCKGDEFRSLYAIRSGFFKTCTHGSEGRTQVTGFQIPGDTLGLDGVCGGQHNVDARALDDSEVCVIPYKSVERLSIEHPSFHYQIQRLMSCEIVKYQSVMMLLGNMRAHERVSAFLLDLSERFKRLGYSATEFNLRMTREDIGSFLGMKVETVSRSFTRLHNEGVISAHGKEIKLLNLDKINGALAAAK